MRSRRNISHLNHTYDLNSKTRNPKSSRRELSGDIHNSDIESMTIDEEDTDHHHKAAVHAADVSHSSRPQNANVDEESKAVKLLVKIEDKISQSI